MSDKPKGPSGELWIWCAPDSSAILGLGLTPQTALADAELRRGKPAHGYACRARLDQFPVNVNPVTVFMHAREIFMMEAPVLEEPRVEVVERAPSKTLDEKLEQKLSLGPSELEEAKALGKIKNGAKPAEK